MAGVSLGTGLSSGIDYSTMISQLMQLEARPQALLRNQLLGTKDDAAAYREINTAFAALSSAAQAVTGDGITAARKASSSRTTVTASAGATAVPGSSLTFSVTALATGQTSMSSGTWSSATGDVRTAAAADSGSPLPGWPLTVVRGGKAVGTIELPPTATLNDAAAAINASGHGLSATVVQLDGGHFKLRVASTAVGEAAAFRLTSGADPTGAAFTDSQAAGNATLDLGGVVASSASNTFADLLTGVSVTVSEVDDGTKPPTTISVANDTAAVTSKVKAMIDAANSVLNTVNKHTDSREGSDATLKGNSTLTSLSSQLLREISSAVGGSSPATVGIQLKRDGTIVFDAGKFASTLTANPVLAQQVAGGRTGVGADNVEHTTDDTIDVDGLAARLSVLAEQASDSAGGMITNLANSQDTRVKDLQKQIDNWDVRLALRRTTLTAQFNALESTLGKLQNQASWLSGQLGSLPSSSNA